MRVCIVQNVSLYDHLGLSTYLRNISKGLAEQKNMEITLIIQKGSKIPADLPKSIDVCEIDTNLYSVKDNLKYALRLYKKLDELGEKENIDIIHCIYPNSSVFGALLFKRKQPKTKIIYDIRSPWIEMSIERGSIPKYVVPIYRKVAYLSECLLSRYVDGFIFITDGLKKFYEDKIELDSKLFDVIPSGVDINLFSKKEPNIIRDRYGLKDNDFLLGYVGGISCMRELSFILEAFQKLTKISGNYKLVFVGDGDDKNHLEELVKKLRIQDNVIFVGRVPCERVPYYMSAFDVGLCHLPDKLVFRYSFPMKVLEYLTCGTPVLVSDIEAHREIAREIDNIYVYKDRTSFFNLILKIKQSDSFNINLKNISIRNYNWSRISQRIISLWGM